MALFFDNMIESKIRFDKQMKTVYDLSYFLVDFQAFVNNLYEIIENDIKSRNMIWKAVADKAADSPLYQIRNIKERVNEHPQWQKNIEEHLESLLFPEVKADRRVAILKNNLKQTTNRKFNKKYELNLQLVDFSQGSLVLEVANALIVSLITEFLKELLFKQTGNSNAITININTGSNYIMINGSDIEGIPKNSCVYKAIRVLPGTNRNELDVKRCIHDVVAAAQPNQNTEESVRRFLEELNKNGLVSEMVIYDERGIKTAVRDFERLKGNFINYLA